MEIVRHGSKSETTIGPMAVAETFQKT
jgi:hypothetical protein